MKPAPRPAPQKRVGTVAPLSTPPTTAVVVPTTSVTPAVVVPVQVNQVESTPAAPVVLETTPTPTPPASQEMSESTQDQQMEAELDDIPASTTPVTPTDAPVELDEQPGPSSSEQTLKRPRSETGESTQEDESKRARQDNDDIEDDGVVVIEENEDVEEPEENDEEVVEVPDDDEVAPVIIPGEDNDELSEPAIEIHAPEVEDDPVDEVAEDVEVAQPVQQQQQRPPALNVPPQLSGLARAAPVAVPSTPSKI